MGYRVRLGSVPKSYRDEIMHLKTDDEWFDAHGGRDEDGYPLADELPYRPAKHTQLYEIGQYVSFSEGMENFYQFDLDEYEFKICTKADLVRIIKFYHEETANYYKELGTEGGISFESHKQSFIREWENDFGINPYYLDETKKDGAIVKSWKMEYAIFNLVHIYQTFDFENNYLIYSGW